jgi:hypothetical protein
MITKITVQLPTLAYEHDNQYESKRLPFATKQLTTLSGELRKIAALVSFLNQLPDEMPVKTAIRVLTGQDATVKDYTKKRRSYSIPYLTVWEEDTIQSPIKTATNGNCNV